VLPPPDASGSLDDRCSPAVTIKRKPLVNTASTKSCILSSSTSPSPLVLPLASVWPTYHYPISPVRSIPHRASYPSIFTKDVGKKLGSRSGEELKSVLRAMTPILEVFEMLRWTLVGMYLCITGGICLLLAFHVHIHRSLPHERRRGSRGCTMYLLS
jgi:hypothetical protein